MKIAHAVGAVVGAFLAIRLFHLLDGPADVQLFALYLAYTACFYVGAALADGKSGLNGALDSDDTRLMSTKCFIVITVITVLQHY